MSTKLATNAWVFRKIEGEYQLLKIVNGMVTEYEVSDEMKDGLKLGLYSLTGDMEYLGPEEEFA